MNEKQLLKKYEKLITKIMDFCSVCYSNKSNDTFDEEYDNLIIQRDCFFQTHDELIYDIENGHFKNSFEAFGRTITPQENFEMWEKDFIRHELLIMEIQKYYNAVVLQNSGKPNYIYG